MEVIGMNFDLDESIGYVIELTKEVLTRELRKLFHQEGFSITPNHWLILYRLWQEDGITQGQLAERTFKDKPSITRLVDYMVKQDLVKRVEDSVDRRRNIIYLTEKGKSLQEVLPKIVETHIEKATYKLKKREVEIAKTVLRKIMQNYE